MEGEPNYRLCSARLGRATPLAGDPPRFPRRTCSPQQGDALPGRPTDCRGDRLRDAPRERGCPRLQAAGDDRDALARGPPRPGGARISEHDLTSSVDRCSCVGARADAGARSGWMDGAGTTRPWLTERLELPAGPLFCVIDGPTRVDLVSWRGSHRVFVAMPQKRVCGDASHPISYAMRMPSSSPARGSHSTSSSASSATPTSVPRASTCRRSTSGDHSTVHARRAPMMSVTAGLQL